MKSKILPVCLSALLFLSACSTAYKSGQTPDDLYYSKAKVVENETREEEKPDTVYEDRAIRMQTYDWRWRTLDDRYDYDYANTPYHNCCNCDYYYNPKYHPYPVYTPAINYYDPKNIAVRKTNLAGYNNSIFVKKYDKGTNTVTSIKMPRYNSSNSSTNRTDRSENRTYNPSNDRKSSSTNENNSSSNTRSSSSGSSSGSVSRPARGN